MKKLFTLIAFFAVCLGAKAEWVEDYKIDYSTYQGFPFYVMGYVPEWVDGVMTDLGGNYTYATVEGAEQTSDVIVKTQAGVEYYRLPSEGTWHQYFIADNIPTEIDGKYTIKAMVKASEPVTMNVNMGWGWGSGQQVGASVTVGTEWAEVEWEYSGIGGSSCNLVAQPNTAAQIEWKWVSVSHNQKEQRPVEWVEQLTNGDAETPWADPDTRFNDTENNYKICAWSKEKGVNMNDDGGWDPFPATIEAEADGNHVFVVHANDATTEGDASAWDNQFWIQSPKSWKAGTQIKVHFRYKASKTVTTNTQIHKQNPSDYLHYEAVGDVTFTPEWQEFDKTFTFSDAMGGGWSIAFNLNPNEKTATDFYFDDLSWKIMKLEEGYFVAGSNPNEGLEYNFDEAIPFEFDDADGCYTATVGTKDAYVSQVMISTVRGNDAAFKSSTLKPSGAIHNDPGEWLDYTEASLAKLNLPGAGIWKIYLDDVYMAMAFEMIEGDDAPPIEINPNPTEIVVEAIERDDLADDNGSIREEEGGTGQPWDNQFWIVANRTLEKGEVTVVEFDYISSIDAKTSTQCHSTPGNYLHWSAIGDVNFSTAQNHFSATFTVPSEANGMQSIAFNMAEIKEACTYTIWNVVWKLEDGSESLIDQEGARNFYVKIGAGTNPYCYGGDDAITSISKEKNTSSVAYNLAGQRVTKDYKGIVIKNGRKTLVK